MKNYIGEVVTGPDGGFIATVSNGEKAFEIHALGDRKNREFYCRAAAEQLAARHAAHMNRRGSDENLHSSYVRRV